VCVSGLNIKKNASCVKIVAVLLCLSRECIKLRNYHSYGRITTFMCANYVRWAVNDCMSNTRPKCIFNYITFAAEKTEPNAFQSATFYSFFIDFRVCEVFRFIHNCQAMPKYVYFCTKMSSHRSKSETERENRIFRKFDSLIIVQVHSSDNLIRDFIRFHDFVIWLNQKIKGKAIDKNSF
jgi:hypothetical protein